MSMFFSSHPFGLSNNEVQLHIKIYLGDKTNFANFPLRIIVSVLIIKMMIFRA